MTWRLELRFLQLLTSVFLGFAACSTSEGEGGDPGMGLRLTQPRSFTVHGTVTSGKEQDFVLRIDPVTMTMLIDGSMVQVQTTDGVTFQAASPPGVEMTVRAAGCARDIAHYERFAVSIAGDRLTGTAAGQVEYAIDDVRGSYAALAQFTGVVDTVGPSLGGDQLDVDPLAPLGFSASEALPANTVAKLAAGADVIDLKVFGDSNMVTGFYVDQVALRYGTTYQLEVSPWMDLAENPGGALAKLLTRAPPPLIGEDGFESAGAPAGGGLVVASDVIAPISGARSLLIQGAMGPLVSVRSPNIRRVTARLPVAPGDRAVRFSIRPVLHSQNQFGAWHGQFRIAVPGGAMVSAVLPAVLAPATSGPLPSAGSSYWLGDVMPVEIALPSGAGSEVTFDAQVPTDEFDHCGIPDLREGYLIDDLRVE